jgi:hypothetical protein
MNVRSIEWGPSRSAGNCSRAARWAPCIVWGTFGIGSTRSFGNWVFLYPQVKILGNAYSPGPDRPNPLDPVPRVFIGPSRAGNFPYLHLRAEMTLHFSENRDYWFDSRLDMCPLSFLCWHVLFIAIVDITCHEASNAMICCRTMPKDLYFCRLTEKWTRDVSSVPRTSSMLH